MNRLKAVSVLVALGSIAIVTVLILPAAQARSSSPMNAERTDPLASSAGVSCMLSTTQTVGLMGNQSFESSLY